MPSCSRGDVILVRYPFTLDQSLRSWLGLP